MWVVLPWGSQCRSRCQSSVEAPADLPQLCRIRVELETHT